MWRQSVTLQQFIDDMNAATSIAEQGLKTAETFDPAITPEAAIVGAVLPIAEQLLTAALNAWSNASGQPITVATVTALLPNQTPLDKPTA
jgi:hypothetical protein